MTSPANPPTPGTRPSVPSGSALRVLVVDDSAFMRSALSRIIASDPSITVVGTARDGATAIEQAKALQPDVVTLDVEMPNMGGMEALKLLRVLQPHPPAVLMCSSLTTAGSHAALQALRLGAADVIAKDHSTFSTKMDEMASDLHAKIKAIGQQRRSKMQPVAPRPAGSEATVKTTKIKLSDYQMMLIGSSTGGPPVLETIITQLPADLSMPVVVAQHMPVLFTKSLAQRLDEMARVTVVHAEAGSPLFPGVVYICPGGQHTHVVKSAAGKFSLRFSEEPKTELYKPSVNVLFATAAEVVDGRILAAVLTGMGEDGAKGAAALRAKNATILAQEQSSCVVYGMPRAIVDRNLADAIGSPDELALMLAGGSTQQKKAA
jgi:two-component system, chemotaxis family, protein-glutamate methylesterase/glutaminase